MFNHVAVQDAFAVTPSDTVNFQQKIHSFWIGGTGAVSFLLSSGKSITYSGVPAGTRLQVSADRINNTGTTATNIIAEILATR